MIIAIKYNEDDYFDNTFYAKVGGVSRKEIDKLEYEFLSLIDFNLYVSEEVFDKYNNYIKSVEFDEDEETEEDEVDQKQRTMNEMKCSVRVS